MKHEELKELLPLYVDGGLDIDELEILEAHLAECEECRIELADYQKNYSLFSTVEDIEVSDDFLTNVMRRVQDEKVESQVRVQPKPSVWNRLKDLMRVRLQIPIGAMGAIAAMILVVALVWIPLSGGLINLEEAPKYNEPYYQNEISPLRSYGEPELAKMQMDVVPELAGVQAADQIEAKIIQTANIKVEVKDIESANENITKITEKSKGFISNSRSWVTDNNRQYSHFQLRISVEQFNLAISEIEGLGRVISHSTNRQDVTEEYIDLASRLKNLKLQEQRYQELLNKAQEVEDVLKIERELERVRSTIESLQGRINYYDNQVSLSTINLDLSEPEPITSSDTGIIKAIRQALRGMVNTVYRMIVGLGVLLPYVIVLLIVIWIFRVFKRRK